MWHNATIERNWKLGNWGTRFMGIPQAHNYALYGVIDDVVEQNEQLSCFVELGTGRGALSVILGIHAVRRGSHLLTYDVGIPQALTTVANKTIFDRLEIEFRQKDVLCDETLQEIISFIDGRPTFFMCDNGAKSLEFRRYVGILPDNSVIAIHDYPNEILKEDIDWGLRTYNLTPIMIDMWDGPPLYTQTVFLGVGFNKTGSLWGLFFAFMEQAKNIMGIGAEVKRGVLEHD